MTVFNPDDYQTTLWRSLKDYIASVVDEDIYEVVFGYPSADDLSERLPLGKTLIHFDISDDREGVLGLGDNFVDEDRTPDVAPALSGVVAYYEAIPHEIDFDIGIWASAESGGVTARLNARTLLSQLFSGTLAYRNCFATTDGVHIKRFGGGRNLIDANGDIPLWRMVDVNLTVQVFSRVKMVPPIPYVGDITGVTQDPDLEIGGTPIVG